MAEGRPRTTAGWELTNYANLLRYLAAISRGSSGSRLVEREGVTASVAPAAAGRSIFNGVAYENGAALEAALDELDGIYREAGVHAWTVWVPDSDRPTADLLAARGHAHDGSPRAMLCELTEIPEMKTEIEVSRGAPWKRVCEINDLAWGHAAGTHERGIGASRDSGVRAYTAAHAGFPAAALATAIEGDDCCVYLVGTLPEARGRGLAGQLLQRALLDARERGARTSTLQSSAMGASVYRRIGYEDVGGLELWEHRTDPPG